MKRLLLSSAALLGLAGTALAADLPEPAITEVTPEVYGATVFNWTGPYVGATVGYGFGSADTRTGGRSRDIDLDGVLGGIYAGYNFQVHPNFLIGAEADFVFTGQSGDGRIAGSRISQDNTWMSTIRARVGGTFDRFLIYGTGGVAFADLETKVRGTGSKTENKVGWTIGAGIETAFTDNIVGRLEYQYVDFGSDTTNIRGTRVKSDFNDNIVRAGVAYKF